MARSAFILLLILAGVILGPREVYAGSIRYFVENYPTLQNGYTVSGTITTNGDFGTSLLTSDITSWNITVTLGSTTIASFTPANSINYEAFFDASPTTLSVSLGTEFINFINLPIGTSLFWGGPNAGDSYLLDLFLSSGASNLLWDSEFPPPQIVATIPEPSSGALALLGAAVLISYGWARSRRGFETPTLHGFGKGQDTRCNCSSTGAPGQGA
jgi:hypothetical protein